MRFKILMLGDDPVSLMADGQLLKERGMMVYTAFNLENIDETIKEISPDLVFFDPQQQSCEITAAYNILVNSSSFVNIPVIYTLTEDDVYLVSRKRTATKEKRNLIADNIIGAVKMALRSNKTYEKKHRKIPTPNISVTTVNVSV